MATKNEIIYSIMDKLSPHLTDDNEISIREISFEIDNVRALFLRNELNKNRTIDSNIIQDLGCVEMEISDTAECCEVSSGCKIIRTKLEIPTAIELHNSTALTRVGPVDKMEQDYSFISSTRAKFTGNGKYNQNNIYAFLHNKKIYLVSKNDKLKFIKYINIAGVFENPEDVGLFSSCSGETCYTFNSKYPINSWMINHITDAVYNKFITTLNIPLDKTNDGDSVDLNPNK